MGKTDGDFGNDDDDKGNDGDDDLGVCCLRSLRLVIARPTTDMVSTEREGEDGVVRSRLLSTRLFTIWLAVVLLVFCSWRGAERGGGDGVGVYERSDAGGVEREGGGEGELDTEGTGW